jgi:hypothetical protein
MFKKSICISASIENISGLCFSFSDNMCTLMFQSGGKLSILGESAFEGCSPLHSIDVPVRLCDAPGLAMTGSGIHGVTVDAGSISAFRLTSWLTFTRLVWFGILGGASEGAF